MLFRTTHAIFANDDTIANARLAAGKIRADFAGFPAVQILYFAATAYDPDSLAAAMHEAFPGAVTMGCTTAGEEEGGRLLHGAVVAMAYGEGVFEYCQTALVLGAGQEAAGENVFTSTDDAMARLGGDLADDPRNLSHRQYVGFMLGDSVSPFSEEVIDRLGELTDVFFLGGFAGGDYKFNNGQRVMYRGYAYRSAALLALWKPRRGFALLKTQAAETTNRQVIITRADEPERIVWEFDGEPAAPLYARMIGVPLETMNVIDFDDNPLAVTAEGEPYLRSASQQVEHRGLRMCAPVRQGTRLTLCRSGDVLRTTDDAFRAKTAEKGPFSAALHINCASRRTTLGKMGQEREFGELFAGLPNIAFASYGEIYVGIISMTSTMVLFK